MRARRLINCRNVICISVATSSVVFSVLAQDLTKANQPEESGRYIDPLDHRARRCIAEVRDRTHKVDVPLVKQNDMRSWGYPDWAMHSWAYSDWDPSGRPFIWLNYTKLSEFPPIVTRFTFYHECAHLIMRTSDEIIANCAGLERMRAAGDLSLRDEATIRENHYDMGALDIRYRGSGKAYWNATIRCAGARLSEDK